MAYKVVLFVDMLGFAALTEAYPVDVKLFRRVEHKWSLSVDEILQQRQNPLVHAFKSFHSVLEETIGFYRSIHPVTSITFSDSAFIATDYLHEACYIASRIAQELLLLQIPVRMGIGFGSFVSLRFKSDISGDRGEHAAHFLGTGVVRAHAAERCGLKGIRIFLGPSAAAKLSDKRHNLRYRKTISIHTVACGDDEFGNLGNVTHELNYWSFTITDEQKAWRGLQQMWDVAPPREKNHYEATARAIDRMRVTQGSEPLKNLRRRTIPKRTPN